MDKICKNQLIGKLVSLFKDTDADIDEAVKEAKNQLMIDGKNAKREDLEKLFNSQMETLKSRGCPQAILEAFQNKKSEVLAKAAEMEIPEGHIPFVPVIPRSYLGVYGLMPMVRNNEKTGYTRLNPNEIIDNENVPKTLYFIYDVEDGKDTLGKAPKDAEKIIKKQNRLCHIPEEDIAVCIHTNVLLNHNLWSAGSRYGSAREVPRVYLRGDEPKLDWFYVAGSFVGWGSASCRSRS